ILYAARRPPFIQVYAVTTVYILTTSSFTIPPHPPSSTLFPYTTLFRSLRHPSGGSHPSCSPLETARARESGRHLQGSSPPLRSRPGGEAPSHDAPVRKDDPLYRSIGLVERRHRARVPGAVQAGGWLSHHERFRSLLLVAHASSDRPENPRAWILLRHGFAAR